jgi:hypothetical protein
MLAEQLDQGVAAEHVLTGKQEVADRPESVQVRARVDRVGCGDRLRRQIERRAGDRVRVVTERLGRTLNLGQAEVDELDVLLGAARRDHDVRRLDVAVYDALGVCIAQRCADLAQDADRALRWQRPLAFDQGLQVDALHVLHREVRRSVRAEPAVQDRDGVRMAEPARELDFTREPGAISRAAALRVQNFDRDAVAERRVPCAVDHTHVAGADRAAKDVRAELASAPAAREADAQGQGQERSRERDGGRKRGLRGAGLAVEGCQEQAGVAPMLGQVGHGFISLTSVLERRGCWRSLAEAFKNLPSFRARSRFLGTARSH